MVKVDVSGWWIYDAGSDAVCAIVASEVVRVKQDGFILWTQGTNLEMPPHGGLQNDRPCVALVVWFRDRGSVPRVLMGGVRVCEVEGQDIAKV